MKFTLSLIAFEIDFPLAIPPVRIMASTLKAAKAMEFIFTSWLSDLAVRMTPPSVSITQFGAYTKLTLVSLLKFP